MSQVNDALRISSQILHRNGKMTLIQTTRDWLTQHCLGTCFPLQTSIIFCSVCIVWSLSWRSMDFKQEDMTLRWQHVAMIGIYYLYIYTLYIHYITSYHIISLPTICHASGMCTAHGNALTRHGHHGLKPRSFRGVGVTSSQRSVAPRSHRDTEAENHCCDATNLGRYPRRSDTIGYLMITHGSC